MQDEDRKSRFAFSNIWPWLLCCAGLLLILVCVAGLTNHGIGPWGVSFEDAVLLGAIGVVLIFHGYSRGLKSDGLAFDPFKLIRNILLVLFLCIIVVKFILGF